MHIGTLKDWHIERFWGDDVYAHWHGVVSIRAQGL